MRESYSEIVVVIQAYEGIQELDSQRDGCLSFDKTSQSDRPDTKGSDQ
jgi:hypothetical protein